MAKSSKYEQLKPGTMLGQWTVLSASSRDARYYPRFHCQCSCGVTRDVIGPSLLTGHSKSCGCSRRGKRFHNLTRCTYGRWRVLGYAGVSLQGRNRTKHKRAWRCLCDPELGGCGKIRVVLAGSLRTGKSTSCGCRRREVARLRFAALHCIEKWMGKQAISGFERLVQTDHPETILKNALGSLPVPPDKGRSA
jgi:hypothetical protein